LGDLFHALPAVHMVRRELDATIDWVTTDVYRGLVEHFTDVDRVIPFYRKAFFSELGPFISELHRDRYDVIIDLQGLLKSALVARLAVGKRRIGPSFHREGARLFYSTVAGVRDMNRHAVEQNLDIVRCLGLPVSDVRFPVNFPECPVDAPRPRVALLPVSRWQAKNWPIEHYAEAGRLLRKAGVASIHLLGGPEDRLACERLEKLIGGEVANLAGRMDLASTGGFLKEMDLLIANDSGPVHMAAAVGTRCLVVFGPTDPDRTGPYGEGHRVLTTDLDCRPCLSRTCRIGSLACLRDLSPERVCDAALEMLCGLRRNA